MGGDGDSLMSHISYRHRQAWVGGLARVRSVTEASVSMDRRPAAARRLPDPPSGGIHGFASAVSDESFFCSAQGSIHRALPFQKRVGSRKVGPAGRQRLAGLAAPANEPHAAPCEGVVSDPCILLQVSLRRSYSGNWMKLKGISRATVVQNPR